MKKRLIKLSASVVVFVFAIVLTAAGVEKTYAAAAFFVAYAIAGIKVIYKAIRNIRYGKVFDENFLMTVASVGAFIIGEYPEAAAVMIFYRFGELFEDYAVGKSRKSIAELMNIRPDCANLKTAEGAKKVSPEEVSVGDVIIVGPGEKIPLDGVVVSGISNLDTAALTGESLPRMAEEGDEVLSGCINLTGLLEIRVTKQFSESTVNKILDLVENATSKKAKTENFITRFAAVYTPAVVIGAALLALLPPLVIEGAQFSDWGYRALNFLVVSCPCALVISVPLGFFGGIGAASKAGILVKGSNYLEAISKTECVVLDKTGTLTKGIFEVEKIEPSEYFDENKVLEYAAIAEQKSVHPISVSLQKAWQQITAKPLASIDKLQEFAGKGVCAVAGDDAILAGNMKLMQEQGISDIAENMVTADYSGTIVYVAVNGKYAGKIMIADAIKEDSQATLSALHSASIDTVMLSGDSCAAAEAAAAALGVGRVAAELLPADKVSLVEQLMEEKRSNGKLVFIGDGINDAPVLARADIGIAMGGLGSDAAIEAADIVIMDDKPSKLLTLIKISQKTMSIVKQNIIFALGIKLLVLLISAAGYGNLWAAVFADVGVSVIAILNSLRVLSNRY